MVNIPFAHRTNANTDRSLQPIGLGRTARVAAVLDVVHCHCFESPVRSGLITNFLAPTVRPIPACANGPGLALPKETRAEGPPYRTGLQPSVSHLIRYQGLHPWLVSSAPLVLKRQQTKVVALDLPTEHLYTIGWQTLLPGSFSSWLMSLMEYEGAARSKGAADGSTPNGRRG